MATDLRPEDVADAKGDGPDGVGNSADDQWQFWFELAHESGSFRELTRHSTAIPAAGIKGKVSGPIASMLPHPAKTTGWILHTDWDGRFEGVWADQESKAVLVHPYVEKTAHMAVAITYRIPADGLYRIAGKLTDVQVDTTSAKHDGVLWKLEVIEPDSGKAVELKKGGPVGDGGGRPDSATFQTRATKMRKGYLIRLVIHPNKWWGRDLTRIDAFRIEHVEQPHE